jgi:hypothetical protein
VHQRNAVRCLRRRADMWKGNPFCTGVESDREGVPVRVESTHPALRPRYAHHFRHGLSGSNYCKCCKTRSILHASNVFSSNSNAKASPT